MSIILEMNMIKNSNFVTIKKMREIDRKAVEYGLPIHLMMENAGKSIAKHILEKFSNYKKLKIVCISGRGNNGGGVISAVRHLTCFGYNAVLIILFKKMTLSKPTNFHLDLIRNNPKIKIVFYNPAKRNEINSFIKNADVIIDGIFGTGFHTTINEPVYDIISQINKSKAYVLSNDVPSGMNGDTGGIANIVVRSNYVLALHKPKPFLEKLNLKFSVVDIGIPPEIDPPSKISLI